MQAILVYNSRPEARHLNLNSSTTEDRYLGFEIVSKRPLFMLSVIQTFVAFQNIERHLRRLRRGMSLPLLATSWVACRHEVPTSTPSAAAAAAAVVITRHLPTSFIFNISTSSFLSFDYSPAMFFGWRRTIAYTICMDINYIPSPLLSLSGLSVCLQIRHPKKLTDWWNFAQR